MESLEKSCELSFAQICYIHFINPGPALVFIHGNSTCKEIFEKQYQTLSNKYHILIFDLPGHGSSSDSKIQPENCYTVPNYARCLKELLDFLKIPKVVIMGSSLGGHIGLDFVSLFPEMVMGIIIAGTPPIKPEIESINAGFSLGHPAGKLTCKLESFTEEESILYHTSAGFSDKFSKVIKAGIRTHGLARSTMIIALASGKGEDELNLVQTSLNPLAIANGVKDPFINHDYINNQINFKNLYENKRFECAHVPFWEVPEEFNPFLEKFYKDVCGDQF